MVPLFFISPQGHIPHQKRSSNRDLPGSLYRFEKNFKNAVQRNLLKRRMREAFRKCKHEIYYSLPKQPNLLIAYIYVGKDVANYKEIEISTVGALRKVIRKLQPKKDNEQKSKD